MTVNEPTGSEPEKHPRHFPHKPRTQPACYDAPGESAAENEPSSTTDSDTSTYFRVIWYGNLTVRDRPRQAKLTPINN